MAEIEGHPVLWDTPGGVLLLWHESAKVYACARCAFNTDPQTADPVSMGGHLMAHLAAHRAGAAGHAGADQALEALRDDRDDRAMAALRDDPR